MLAKDLKPSDTVEGWTVTEASLAVRAADVTEVVLLTLERKPDWRLHDGRAIHIPFNERITETKRTWYRADEEVEDELLDRAAHV